MNLPQLIQEAEERFEKKALEEFYIPAHKHMEFKNFLKTELEKIVKESFKNTRVEEKPIKKLTTHEQTWYKTEGYNQALGDKHNKECEFLGY